MSTKTNQKLPKIDIVIKSTQATSKNKKKYAK